MLKWSLYWLFLGIWPRRDVHGNRYTDEHSVAFQKASQPLAGGYYGVLWILKGDLEHMTKAYGLANPRRVANPCSLCQANGTTRPWTDGRINVAAWVPSIWAPNEWLDAHPDRNILFHLPGVSVTSYIPDVMHALHLGAYQYAFGSVLQYLTRHIMDDTPGNNLSQIWTHVDHYYKDKLTHDNPLCHPCSQTPPPSATRYRKIPNGLPTGPTNVN